MQKPRGMLALLLSLALTIPLLSCDQKTPPVAAPAPKRPDGRLKARTGSTPHTPACRSGLSPLGVAAKGDSLLYVPAGARRATTPLLVFLHGARGTPRKSIEQLRAFADRHGIIVLLPQSRQPTWDALMEGLGPDLALIDTAITKASARCAFDPSRVAVGGFSDGASYALTLGLANGDLFTHVIALSPCHVAESITRKGQPRIMIAHGEGDQVFPIERCGRRIAGQLRNEGYDVRYGEFPGGHEVPAALASSALSWMTE